MLPRLFSAACPLALALSAVIGRALFGTLAIRLVRHVQPAVAAGEMSGYPESQPGFQSCLAPHTDQIFLGSHVDGVPTVMLRVPQIEVVVMDGARAEILRT